MAIEKKRGRPVKYKTEEERKAALRVLKQESYERNKQKHVGYHKEYMQKYNKQHQENKVILSKVTEFLKKLHKDGILTDDIMEQYESPIDIITE